MREGERGSGRCEGSEGGGSENKWGVRERDESGMGVRADA